MPNPFVIDAPAPADQLIDREDQLRRLVGLAEGGHNARLSAPRRYGKTTLLARLARDVGLLGMRSVYVDLFGVISLSDLAGRVEHAYIDALKGPLAAWFAGLRRKWRVRGRAGMPGARVELESLPAEEAEERLGELLGLVQGHPQRAMLMAHHLWEAPPAGATAGDEQWASAVHAAFAELQETFERYWERLSANERRVLAAVAWGGRWGGGSSLYAKRTLARFNLSKGTARDVSRELARRGDLRRGAPGGPYELVDPLLEAWVASGRRPWL